MKNLEMKKSKSTEAKNDRIFEEALVCDEGLQCIAAEICISSGFRL